MDSLRGLGPNNLLHSKLEGEADERLLGAEQKLSKLLAGKLRFKKQGSMHT